MKSNTTTILVAVGALLVGGVATAAFLKGGDTSPTAQDGLVTAADGALVADDAAATDNQLPVGTLQYAEVVKAEPITSSEKLYATVIGTEPVRETTTTSTPREVCEDVVVQERLPERDGNAGGTVAGAVIGGLLGNQVDKRHVGGKVVNRTERQCHTENATSESSRVTGYNVTYRNPDGTTGTMRMDSKPGTRIAMGTTDKVIGYDVTYRFEGQDKTIRMDQKPGERLPVIDGQVVTQTASVDAPGQG